MKAIKLNINIGLNNNTKSITSIHKLVRENLLSKGFKSDIQESQYKNEKENVYIFEGIAKEKLNSHEIIAITSDLARVMMQESIAIELDDYGFLVYNKDSIIPYKNRMEFNKKFFKKI